MNTGCSSSCPPPPPHTKIHLNTKIKKLTHLILVDTWRVAKSMGGTEKVLCEMANAMVEKGYEVTILFHEETRGGPYFSLSDKVHYLNTYEESKWFDSGVWRNLRCLRLTKKQRHVARATFSSKNIAKHFKKALSNIPKPDVFVCFTPEAAYIIKEILKYKIPLISMYHFNPEYFLEEKIFRQVYKDAVTKSTLIQVLMPEYVDSAKKIHPGANIVCIPNSTPQYDDSASVRSHKIINIARVTWQKRPELLIKAFGLLKDKYSDWVCEWYGETKFDERCSFQAKQLAQSLGVADRFIFKGTTSAVGETLKTASIFAFPSAFEGQPLALMEGMAIGLPVVGCKDCPSVNTLIRDDVNGFLVASEPTEVAAALDKLMASEQLRLRLGKMAKHDMANYTPERIWCIWDSTIKSILKK